MTNKVSGIDRLMEQIYPFAVLFEEYSEIKQMAAIIKMCRLKPRSMLKNKRLPTTLKVCKSWVDEYGNSVELVVRKKSTIFPNDLSIDRKQLVISDLYEQWPVTRVGAISQAAFILAGKTKQDYQDFFVVAFLGLDEYLRCFYYLDGAWYKFPPLYLGIRLLRAIANHRNQRYLKPLQYKAINMYPCSNVRTWITSWPNDNELRKTFSGDLALEKLLRTLTINGETDRT